MPRPTAIDIEQLQNVKAGDSIVVSTFNGYHHEWRVCEVSKVTGHRIYCTNIWCFTKKDGKQYGGISRYRAWAYPATPKNLATVDDYKRERAEAKLHNELRRYLSRTSFRHAPIEHLELAVAILKNDKLTLELADRMAWYGVNGLGAAEVEDYEDVIAAFEKLWDDLDERIATYEDHREDEGGR